MITPVYRVLVGARRTDISDRIERFRFEHSTKKDNILELTIKREFSEAMADDDIIVSDAVVNFTFGLVGGPMSIPQTMKVSDIEVTYADRITMLVRCMDDGNTLKKNSPQTIWKNTTAALIAAEIAKANGLKADVQNGTDLRKITEEAQGGKSDYEFLSYLSSQEAGYIFFVDSETLHFKKRSTNKASSITYTYGDGRLKSFSPKLRKSTQMPQTQSANVTVIDPDKKTETTVADDSGTKLGKYRFDQASELLERTTDEDKGKKVYTPPTGVKGATTTSNAMASDSNLKVLEAGLIVYPNPLLLSDMVVTMAGVARKYAGNWLVTKVVHEITASGGISTSGEITKDGTNKPITPGVGENPDVNKTEGPKVQDKKKKIHRFDQNSNFNDRLGKGSQGTW